MKEIFQGAVLLFTALFFVKCASSNQLAESCLEPGKMYRNLGSLKTIFASIDTTFLPGILKLSRTLPDKWIQYSAEHVDSLEVRVVDYSTYDYQHDTFSFTFAGSHRHIVYPTFPRRSQVKLPCFMVVYFQSGNSGITEIYGDITIEVKLSRHKVESVYSRFKWNRLSNRIIFTKEGGNTPMLYWVID